jgi:hypothetical protein
MLISAVMKLASFCIRTMLEASPEFVSQRANNLSLPPRASKLREQPVSVVQLK